MTDKKKLVELLKATRANAAWHRWGYEEVADYLIANGVTFETDNNVGSKWIPVTERLPETDARVLVWVGENRCNFPMIDTDRIHNGRWVRWDGYITHWMPLPEAPKGE